MNDVTKVIFVVAFIAVLVVIGPIALIWSLNTLFPVLAIPYTLESWLAAFIVSATLRTTVKVNK